MLSISSIASSAMSSTRKGNAKAKQVTSTETKSGVGGPRDSTLVATSQTSRFHTETLVTLSNDIDLKDVHLAIGPRVLLSSAHLRLFRGVRYGLVGANGVGKSTLLRAMGHGLLAGTKRRARRQYDERKDMDDMEGIEDVSAICPLWGLLLKCDTGNPTRTTE